MVAGTEMWLQRLMNKLNDTAKNLGIQINIKNKNHGSSLGRRLCC